MKRVLEADGQEMAAQAVMVYAVGMRVGAMSVFLSVRV